MFQFQMVHEFLLSLSEDIFEILRFLEDHVFYPSFEYLVCFWVVKLCFDEIAEKEDVNYLVFIVGTFLIGCILRSLHKQITVELIDIRDI